MKTNISPSVQNTFFIDYVGCEKRKLDAERIIKYLEANGYKQIVNENKIQDTDVIVVVTCGFNSEYSNISKKKIDHLLDLKGSDSTFIVSGCLPDIEPEWLHSQKISHFAGPRDLTKFDKILEGRVSIELIPEQNQSCFDNEDYSPPNEEFRSWILSDYTRAKNAYKIRVCWGCLGKCSYCVVRKATKKLKSKTLDEVLIEYERGYNRGHRRFFITGGDVGAYGIDIGSDFTELISLLTSKKGVELYLQEVNASWIVKYHEEINKILMKNIDSYHKIVMNIPMQSGSDKILKAMKRPYDASEVVHSIRTLRNSNHKFLCGGHFIVGFPRETEADFNKTKKIINSGLFDFIMVFTYSDNKGAESYHFSDKIDSGIAEKRRMNLLGLQKKIDIEKCQFYPQIRLSLDEIHDNAKTIDGWLTKNEGEALFLLAKKTDEGNIIEIGSWHGKSTYYLAKGIENKDSYVISIDHHTGSIEQRNRTKGPIDTLPNFISNMRRLGVSSKIKMMVMNSSDASKKIKSNSASLIFLDGSHEYEFVKEDFNAFWSKLKQNGIFAIHDVISKPGTSDFIYNMVNNRTDIKLLKIVDDLLYFQKTRSDAIYLEMNKTFLQKRK